MMQRKYGQEMKRTRVLEYPMSNFVTLLKIRNIFNQMWTFLRNDNVYYSYFSQVELGKQ